MPQPTSEAGQQLPCPSPGSVPGGSCGSGNWVSPWKHLAITLKFPADSIWPSQRHFCLGSLLRNPPQGRGARQNERQPQISHSPRPSSSHPHLTDLQPTAEEETGPHSNLLCAFSSPTSQLLVTPESRPQISLWFPRPPHPGAIPVCGPPEGRFMWLVLAKQDVYEGQQRGQVCPLVSAEEHVLGA